MIEFQTSDGIRIAAAAGTILAATGGLAALALPYAVQGRSSQVFGPSVYKGPGTRKSFALTFDDGPSPGTLQLLDYLAEQKVHATFFQCGMNVERYPEIAQAVFRAGHEIGNHTYSHPRLAPRIGWQMNFRSRAEIFHEFARTQEILGSLGIHPTLLRAPYGMRWFGMRAVQRRLRMLGVMWTVIGHDWEWKAEQVADLVLKEAAPGGIACLHDGRDTSASPDIAETIAAVKRIVPALREQGYLFETATEILRG